MGAGGLRRLLLVMIGTLFSRRLSKNLSLNIIPRLPQGYTKVTLRLIRFLNPDQLLLPSATTGGLNTFLATISVVLI